MFDIISVVSAAAAVICAIVTLQNAKRERESIERNAGRMDAHDVHIIVTGRREIERIEAWCNEQTGIVAIPLPRT